MRWADEVLDDAQGEAPGGPISATAARMQDAAAGGRVGGGSMGSTVYPPFAPAGTLRVREQAGRLKECLVARHAHRAMDPYWGARFWQDVIMEDNHRGLEAEVRAVLQGHGFLGEATMGAPGATLEKALSLIHI